MMTSLPLELPMNIMMLAISRPRAIMRRKSNYTFVSAWDAEKSFIRDLRSNRRNEIGEIAVDLSRRDFFLEILDTFAWIFQLWRSFECMMVSNCKLNRCEVASKENGVGEGPIATDCVTSYRSASSSSESASVSITHCKGSRRDFRLEISCCQFFLAF